MLATALADSDEAFTLRQRAGALYLTVKVAGGGRPQRREVLGKHVRPAKFRVKETGANTRAAGAPEEEILADRPHKGAFNLRGH